MHHVSESINFIALLFPAFLMVFTFRGFFRALAARWAGDETAYNEGFLTLNPLAHVDLYGMIIVLFVLFFIGGIFPGPATRPLLFVMLILVGVRWSIPVPIDESNFKNYKLGVLSTTLAGPMGCFMLAFLGLLAIHIFPTTMFPDYVFLTILKVFSLMADLAIFWGVIDLLPLPPFDGSRLLPFIFPPSMHDVLAWLEEYSLFIFLFLFFVPGVSDYFFELIRLITSGVYQFLNNVVIHALIGWLYR